ncbi:non-ribosomal peptide synthetase [Verrucosispora sp. WMMD573]|nr:non-ribosomal peptide synthetase [Verrucosispora sp. WMMD573]WBB53722.1 non-ribosomal peptide synthetase [Verrucosispora sp. WMMD573]
MPLWSRFETRVSLGPAVIAVRDADPRRTVTYGQLRQAAEAHSALLHAAGVRAGDCVAVTARRSAGELVAILAVLRLGAAYLSIEPEHPPALAREMLQRAGVRVVTGEQGRLAAAGDALAGLSTVVLPTWGGAHRSATPTSGGELGPVPPACAVAEWCCVVFVPGRDGKPQPAPVALATIAAAVDDPGLGTADAYARFMRRTPLATLEAPLEIFAPLLTGGTVEVCGVGSMNPAGLGAFLRERRISALHLSGARLRQIAEYRPTALAGVTQVFSDCVGVPPDALARQLTRCPELVVTAYRPGPRSMLVHHFRQPDDAGHPLVEGLLAGSAHDDRIVPVQGTAVNLDGVAAVLRTHPDVVDAGATLLPGGRVLAGVVSGAAALSVAGLRAHVERWLHSAAVPSQVTLMGKLPRTADGELDEAGLREAAAPSAIVARPAPSASARTAAVSTVNAAPAEGGHALADTVLRAWRDVLGEEREYHRDDSFFDVGGSSLLILRLRAVLQQAVPDRPLDIEDLYRHSTLGEVTALLAGSRREGIR